MKCRIRLIVFFLASLVPFIQRASAAADYVRICTLRASEILPVAFDKERDTYVQVNGLNTTNITIPGNRQLRAITEEEEVSPAISVSRYISRFLQSTEEVHFVRQCQCSFRPGDSEFAAYCPLEKSTCGIPRSTTEPIGCFNQSSRTSLIRNAWPVIVLWYGGLLLFLVFTTQGQNARHYVIGKCCKRNLNEQLIERYWYVEGGFWRRRRRPRRPLPAFLQDARHQARRRGEEEVPPLPPNTLDHLVDTATTTYDHPPNQLALKTKRYIPPSIPAEDEDDVACTICFSPLEEGDRVGALPCSHVFHVACLKSWLPRRNICPLCQAPDVAAPQYEPRVVDEDDNSIVEQQHDEVAARSRQEESQPRQSTSLSQALEEHTAGMHRRGNLGTFYRFEGNMMHPHERRSTRTGNTRDDGRQQSPLNTDEEPAGGAPEAQHHAPRVMYWRNLRGERSGRR